MMNSIDFSKTKRIAPRSDSWAKVCARLDATQAKSSRFIKFKAIYSAVPLAASIAIVACSLWLSGFNISEKSTLPMEGVASEELTQWYSQLGEDTFNDELETLDESSTISYLIKEE